MKRLLIGLLGLAIAQAGRGAGRTEPVATEPVGIAIHVIEGGWGSADTDDIRLLLEQAGRLFDGAFGKQARPRIQVRHRFGTPRVLHDASPQGELIIELTARNDRWYQYVYQYSHELCHVLAHFERNDWDERAVRANQWFEESLCETASLYALRRLGAQGPPGGAGPRPAGAGRQFGAYAQQLLEQPHRRLSDGSAFSSWYAANRDSLRDEPYQREKNELVAAVLLPLFEGQADAWRSLPFLPADLNGEAADLAAYLQAWRNAAPAQLQPFISRIEGLFGL